MDNILDRHLNLKEANQDFKDCKGNWNGNIPYLSFPAHFKVQILPASPKAVLSFYVKSKDSEKLVSVFLDCYNKFGGGKEPYWGACNFYDEPVHVLIHNTEELITTIDKLLKD